MFSLYRSKINKYSWYLWDLKDFDLPQVMDRVRFIVTASTGSAVRMHAVLLTARGSAAA